MSHYKMGVLTPESYNLLNGSYDEQGSLRYSAKKNVLCENKWIYIKTESQITHSVHTLIKWMLWDFSNCWN